MLRSIGLNETIRAIRSYTLQMAQEGCVEVCSVRILRKTGCWVGRVEKRPMRMSWNERSALHSTVLCLHPENRSWGSAGCLPPALDILPGRGDYLIDADAGLIVSDAWSRQFVLIPTGWRGVTGAGSCFRLEARRDGSCAGCLVRPLPVVMASSFIYF